MYQKAILLVSLVLLSISGNGQDSLTCEQIFDFMYGKWNSVRNMTYRSAKYERKLDEYESAEFDFTVQRKPFKVAGKMLEKGHYLLYDPAVNAKQAAYISNGFPYTNLMLDIHGKIFRGLNHYTISDAGCEFIFNIIRKQYELMPHKFYCGKQVRKGRQEYVIQAKTDEWRFYPYKALPGETVLDIAKKLSVNAYLILERNPSVSEYTQVCTGLTLMVPSHYGIHVKLHIDAVYGLPTLIETYDEKGLFERYEYSDYKINVNLPANYFTIDYLDSLN